MARPFFWLAPVSKPASLRPLGGDLRAFAEEYALTFPILHDPEGTVEELYRTTGVPESFVIGRDGLIYKKVAGETEWDLPVNQELVRRLLDG